MVSDRDSVDILRLSKDVYDLTHKLVELINYKAEVQRTLIKIEAAAMAADPEDKEGIVKLAHDALQL